VFADRRDAGRAVAHAVAALGNLGDAVVLALPRGGVPVAYEVASALHLPLDVLLVRKLGAPFQPELAVGAVADGGIVVLNEDILEAVHLSRQSLEPAIADEQIHIRRQADIYRRGRAAVSIEGRTVILVDDGLATGATMRAAIQVVRPSAHRVIAAVPVGPPETCAELAEQADDCICVEQHVNFDAVGLYYTNFDQTSDAEVCALLDEANNLQRPRTN